MSDVARSLARSSSARPTSTKPSSMAGSSKKVRQPSAGTAAATQLTPNDATAPKPTSVFMSSTWGVHGRQACVHNPESYDQHGPTYNYSQAKTSHLPGALRLRA